MQGKPNVESWEASKTVWARGTPVKKNASDNVRRCNPSDKANDSLKRHQWEPFFGSQDHFLSRESLQRTKHAKRQMKAETQAILKEASEIKWISPKDLQE